MTFWFINLFLFFKTQKYNKLWFTISSYFFITEVKVEYELLPKRLLDNTLPSLIVVYLYQVSQSYIYGLQYHKSRI